MKKQELYSISHKGKILYAEGLTEEEYMDKMQDLADEFFENGTPHPLELRTDVIKKRNLMAKTFSMGNTIETRPKKTRQGKGKHSKYSATSRNSARKRYKGQGK